MKNKWITVNAGRYFANKEKVVCLCVCVCMRARDDEWRRLPRWRATRRRRSCVAISTSACTLVVFVADMRRLDAATFAALKKRQMVKVLYVVRARALASTMTLAHVAT